MGRKRSRSRSRSSGGISRRSLLLLAGVGTASATGAYTTGAFDAVTGDRSFDVGTADDDTAMLGVDIGEPDGVDGATVTLFEVTNRFGEALTSFDAEIVDGVDGPVDPNSLRTPQSLPPEATGKIRGTLSCSDSVDRTIEVAISASGAGQSVELTRSVDVTCTRPARGVCTPRSPPGCKENEFPSWDGTDCSVVIDTTGEIDETIGGGVEIGGAVDLITDDAVSLTVRGSVADYFGVETSGEIDFFMGGGGSIGGPLQLSTNDEVTIDIVGFVGGGLCADEIGALDVSVGRGGTIDGEISLTSHDELSVDLDGDASVGPLSVQTPDEADITVSGGSEIDGNLDVNADGEVEVDLDGNERVRGDVTIDSDDEVTLELSGSSVIEGDVTIDTIGEVTVTVTRNSAIEGNVQITTEDEVEFDIRGSSTIGGDLSINTDDEIDVSGCRNIEGEVSPASACGRGGGP